MYPYHNKIKQRIKNRELIKFEYVDRYKNISPCLLLHFSTEPNIRPIREHRFEEYDEILNKGVDDITFRS
ncbi:MAG: hypothetical protein ACJA0Q_001951 [Saprospiraceae bacterium]|jgi:hypothetical protein